MLDCGTRAVMFFVFEKCGLQSGHSHGAIEAQYQALRHNSKTLASSLVSGRHYALTVQQQQAIDPRFLGTVCLP